MQPYIAELRWCAAAFVIVKVFKSSLILERSFPNFIFRQTLILNLSW